MSPLAVSSIVFAIVIAGAAFGMFLRKVLPQHYLGEDSKDMVKMGMGLVATMSALVLGLLVSSAKSSFDALSSEMVRASSNIILLDRNLALYGTETKSQRELLRSAVTRVADNLKNSGDPAQVHVSNNEIDALYEQIQGLSPKDERHGSIQAHALALLTSLQEMRWLMYEQESTSISMPMLVILLSWLTTLFVSFGLFAPSNGTAIGTLLVSALSVSGAILLILELYTPYQGLISLSGAPLRAALSQLGN